MNETGVIGSNNDVSSSEESENKSQSKFGRVKLVAAILCLLITISFVGTLGYVKISTSRMEERLAKEATVVLDAFGTPGAAVGHTADIRSTDAKSLTVTRTWNGEGSVKDSCAQIRDRLRGFADNAPEARVTGEYKENLSCTYSGQKNGVDFKVVAVGSDDAQETSVTMTATKKS